MRVMMGGVRGSFPLPRRDSLTFGGETTCVLIEGRGGERVLLDLGTGVRRLADRLAAAESPDLLVLMSHYHLDHVVGLPLIPHLYDAGRAVVFAAPPHSSGEIQNLLPRVIDEPFWPLQLHAMAARISYVTLPGASSAAPLPRGGLELRWTPVHHPAGCTAYRLDEPATGDSVVFATDVEWALSGEAERADLLRLCREPRPAGLLLFDGAFTPEDYPRHRDWGHSTWEDAVAVARETGVRRLRVIHHDHRQNDRALDRVDRAVRRALPGAALAREGDEIEPAAAGGGVA